ncbi:MAG: hypothetical protein AAGB02_06995 [Pseudomonadota bacterium]
MSDQRLKISLFILRLTVAAFFAIWAAEKFIKPDVTARIWEAFYMVSNLPYAASYAIGGLQALAIFCFFFGILKFWSYGFLMLIHGLGTVLTYDRLLNPYDGGNHLFWAAVPTLGALIALFIMRHEDTLFTISGRIKALQ